ncbi:WALLS ARE THIN 1-like [Olea europaea subsp. europaea]|uniref:WALLS ARE THIN 1-like n=1 Tax=Olea europaea subsp. europaea TaxID=158383 RepID=A0A8S0QV44_OLEEU|nr:WALLS ARE THIN 1-like [Olea europaea subsp. europaea]
MYSILEKFQLHLVVLALQFGYPGFHVVSRAALNMGISKIVFPVYRNILALLLLSPFAYFLEKKERPPLTRSFASIFPPRNRWFLVIGVFMERDLQAWLVRSGGELFSVFYAGIVASGIAFAVQIWCIDRGGPVFVAVYQPVQTLVVAIMASAALGEEFYLEGYDILRLFI